MSLFRKLARLLPLLCLFVAGSPAHALEACYQEQTYVTTAGFESLQGCWASPGVVEAKLIAAFKSQSANPQTCVSYTAPPASTSVGQGGGGVLYCTKDTSNQYGGAGTPSYPSWTFVRSPDSCPIGVDRTKNSTIGYTNIGPDGQSATGPLRGLQPPGLTLPPQESCDGQCRILRGSPTRVWIGEVPTAQGLYRVSADFVFTYTGGTCTGGDPGTAPVTPAIDPSQPPPPCTGYSGTVDGRKVCIPASGNDSPPVNGPVTPGAPYTGGNPPAGSPAEGSPPTRTPGTGDGGPAGGPGGGGGGAVGGPGGGGTPGGGSGNTGQPGEPASPASAPEAKTDCDKYPNAVGCLELGQPPGGDSIPTASRSVGFGIEAVGLAEGCPAPVVVYKNHAISFETPCQVATMLRPLLIAMAFFGGALMVIRAIRS